ncbi:DUF3306 domain-containing protein [Belnapia sp. T18]|uniref:DUF3306 domain-containing protein n=1 Tax=Belnapia arida TaxID=2804533 RepID=A0ABS1TX41_9PROT|nr:DUF3306 domain-containing protein [Belnapia arida]MBL6077011.1 DUF3306 domain-containing protein [Belnapia arida]
MSEEGFLSRWSRRKREALRGPPEPQAEAPPPAFDPDSLPPVESLTEASDITAFLRAEVPAALRRAALRRAWTLDPSIRDFVGPADYAWDYNAPDGVPGFAHALGGDVKRLLAQAIGALEEVAAGEPEEVPPPDTLPDTLPELTPPVLVPPDAAEPVPEPPVLAEGAAPPPEAPPAPLPRRRHGGALPV